MTVTELYETVSALALEGFKTLDERGNWRRGRRQQCLRALNKFRDRAGKMRERLNRAREARHGAASAALERELNNPAAPLVR